MNNSYLIKNAFIINEGKISKKSVLIEGMFIKAIIDSDNELGEIENSNNYLTINAEGQYLLPGVIDDQVHFREPGLTNKADIYTESKAAVAGGVTSYMDMPNTIPNAVTLDILEEKYYLASQKSLANYSFFLGATNNNIDEILKADNSNICGVKIFMGSSTGNMLVNDKNALEQIFKNSKLLIACHCEDEETIKNNTEKYKSEFGENIPFSYHHKIRSAEACYKSTKYAVELAKKYNSRLHVLHLTTSDEIQLFSNNVPLAEKLITSEVCVHHLWFDADDYEKLGGLIKCNPSIKEKYHKEALFNALLNNNIDIIASDHAPHTFEEKNNNYLNCPSGLPLVQFTLPLMIEFFYENKISLEKIVDKMCHSPALCYRIDKRGFIKQGYYADLVIVDINKPYVIKNNNIVSKCGWSPFEGLKINSEVQYTFVNGNIVYNKGFFNENIKGKRLTFKY